MKICNLALSYGRIAKIAAQFSHGLENSAMGQIPCSTERISCVKYHQYADDRQIYIAISKDDSAVQLWVSFCSVAVTAVSTTCSVSKTVNLSSVAIQPAAILKSLSVVLDHSL